MSKDTNRRVMAILAYDGSDFSGYQYQEGCRTVQEEIEKALQKIFKEKVETYAAGRTDTGVHANGQVVTFLVKYKTMQDHDVKNAINAYLPNDVYIRKVYTVDEKFNPRFAATRRIYHYYVLNTKEPDIFLRQKYWWFPYSLNIEKMRIAAKYLEGVHDFESFMKRGKDDEKDPVRVIYRVRIFPIEKKKVILIRIEGHSFLRRMVRNIVGALVKIGTNQIEPIEMKNIILKRDRRASNTTAPPDGLYLYKVEFGEVDEAQYMRNAIWSENGLLEGKEWFKAEL